jgi:hypothetical protein
MDIDPLASEYLRFCRPVCAETGHDDFPFQRVGSGFVVSFAGHFFLLSTKHAFRNVGADASRTRIPLTLSDHRPWPVLEFTLTEAIERFGTDDAYADVGLFWLDPTATSATSITAFDYLPIPRGLTTSIDGPLLTVGHPLFAFGFPDKFSKTSTEAFIDDEAKMIHTDLVSVEGRYDGTTSDFGLHLFRTDDMGDSDPNGFSGGPVTTLDLTRIGHHRLVGMILRSGAGVGVFRFLSVNLIVDLLANVFPLLGNTSRKSYGSAE